MIVNMEKIGDGLLYYLDAPAAVFLDGEFIEVTQRDSYFVQTTDPDKVFFADIPIASDDVRLSFTKYIYLIWRSTEGAREYSITCEFDGLPYFSTNLIASNNVYEQVRVPAAGDGVHYIEITPIQRVADRLIPLGPALQFKFDVLYRIDPPASVSTSWNAVDGRVVVRINEVEDDSL